MGLLILPVALLLFAAPQTPEDALKEQARLHPASFEANHQLGEFYVRRHDLAAAVPWLRRAYAIDSANYGNGYDLALALLETKALEEARRVVEDLLKRKETSELHNLLGEIEETAGNTLDGVRQYETAARMDASEKNVFDLGSDLLRHQGFDQAATIFGFGVSRYPASARLRAGLGVAYYPLGRYLEAVESFCAAADIDPADVRGLEFLGKMVDVSPEMAEEVRKRLARLVNLHPDNAAANYYYALSLRKRALTPGLTGQEGEVEAHLVKAIRLDPNMADAHYQLGLLYQDERQEEKAIREFEVTVRLSPRHKSAHYHLARLYAAKGRQDLARREFDIFRSLPQ